jgi:hypothetical protein
MILFKRLPIFAFLAISAFTLAAQTTNPIPYKKGKLYGYKDSITNKPITSPKFNEAERFSGNFAKVIREKKLGIIDKTGKNVISPRYDELGEFTEGFIKARLGKKWCFVNDKGIKITPIKYDEVRDYHEGMAAVRIEKLWGFLDTTGKVIIPIIYTEVSDFFSGLAAVSKDGEDYAINTKGEREMSKY